MKTTHIVRKSLNILLYLFLGLILFLILFILAIKLFEGKITQLAIHEVEKTIKAPISYGQVSIIPFRDFPNLTVRISDFKLGQQSDSVRVFGIAQLPDTLIGFKNVFISIRAYPLIHNNIQVEGFELNGFRANYVVDSTGRSNFDFLIPSDTLPEQNDSSVQTILNILLKNLTISDINLTYFDSRENASANINISKLHLNGRVTGDSIQFKSFGDVVLSRLTYQDFPVNKLNKAALSYSIEYDNGNVTISLATLETDGIQVRAKGNVVLSDSIWIDMGVALPKINLIELSKFIPDSLTQSFGIDRVAGQIALNSTIRGYLYDTIMFPSVFVDFALKNGYLRTTKYPKIKRFNITGSLAVPNTNFLTTTSISIKKLDIQTEQSSVNLSLTLKNPNKPVYNIQGNLLINLDEFTPLLPDSTLTQLSGIVEADFYTKGKLPEYLGLSSSDYFMANSGFNINLRNISAAIDSINAITNLNAAISFSSNKQLNINGLELQLPGYNLKVTNGLLKATLNGDISYPEKIDIKVDTLNIALGSSLIGLKFKVRNLQNPVFRADGLFKVNLNEIKFYLPDTLVSYITGLAELKFNTYGNLKLDSLERDLMPIIFENSRFSATVTDFGFSLPNDTLIGIDHLSFNMSMANDTIRLNNLSGRYKDLEFQSDSTSIWNAYKTIIQEQKNKKLIINTSLWASRIDYAMFLPFMAEDTTTNIEADSIKTETIEDDSSSSYMPQYIIRGIAKVDRIKYGKILISDLSTKFRLDDSLYVIDDMRLKAFGGTMVTSAIYDTRKAPLEIIEFKNESKNINIKQLLAENEDFEQDYFTHKNIEGLLTGTVFGRVVMQDTNIFYEKFNLMGDFTLEDGGIYNFEPAMELSKFTNLKELDNIVFRTLKTKVFIYNNQIYFPKTDIVSTAMDMSVYGMQSFGDDYEYHFVVYPGDMMFGKSKKLLKRQGLKAEDFEGDNKAKRSGLYLVALERGKNSKYSFDTKQLQRVMKATIRVQERGLNLVFHPYVMNFSTDLDRKEFKPKVEKDGKKDQAN